MKFTLITAIATLATVVAGTPTMSALEAREAEAEAAGLVPRACPGARSGCRLDWAKKCEWYCQNRGGFLVMESCYLGFSRCCCRN
ncbi:hypothetical protein COCVIDRAFT_38683 [Bipolaris victoriae FI3]|uniref:Invertebrate defensins family profile domain-containing protein n=2 Tax=Bipolaris TaxID=33194 RepID=W6XM37_COCC2|nr:uncharacterized protein COCCADRAFT_41169 [Bipolaris zeicola 26-R-13]XP_014555644.1 hypothetical protein COCVIDRAFT_38683 [Bipolaris victoriae FI3]EUC28292.1 hypothetical protein COCCADRAFT_41169 [Bipolaris zeicola 26-R-13]